MQDKIDLKEIIVANQRKYKVYFTTTDDIAIEAMMKEAIHQALVLAAKHAKVKKTIGSGYTAHDVDTQSILDVDKLIV